MTKFQEILTSSGESLLKMLYRSSANGGGRSANNAQEYARNLRLTYAQLVCALGFNRHIQDLPDVITIIGFDSYEALAKQRNHFFSNDIYDRLGIKDVLAIYAYVPDDMKLLPIMQYLLSARLAQIESRIEATVNSIVIERYKKEMRAIYSDGVAQIEFAEERLDKTHSGFRALLNEVSMIVQARLIPIGDIFFRDNILPEEKRRLILKGFIPKDLIEQRLEDSVVPELERIMLVEQLARL
ncbi:MAG: hypothetical protein ACI9BW_001200 [Gammaproteobacteria bacterium]|jgi:hypothetical protein